MKINAPSAWVAAVEPKAARTTVNVLEEIELMDIVSASITISWFSLKYCPFLTVTVVTVVLETAASNSSTTESPSDELPITAIPLVSKRCILAGLSPSTYVKYLVRPPVVIFVGFSALIFKIFKGIEGVEIKVPDQNSIIVEGVDKGLVGQVAANIRAIKPPEPYKGKGIRYVDEYVRKKAGKTATA